MSLASEQALPLSLVRSAHSRDGEPHLPVFVLAQQGVLGLVWRLVEMNLVHHEESCWADHCGQAKVACLVEVEDPSDHDHLRCRPLGASQSAPLLAWEGQGVVGYEYCWAGRYGRAEVACFVGVEDPYDHDHLRCRPLEVSQLAWEG